VIVRTIDSKDKIAYPQHDSTLPVAYYLDNFQKPVAYYLDNFQKVAEANELAEALKATACAAPLQRVRVNGREGVFQSDHGCPHLHRPP
jgi:hypothetical protein